MVHFALICPPLFSHLRTFEVIGEALVSRGHRATMVLNAGGGSMVRSPRLAVQEVGGEAPDLDGIARRAARPTGLGGILRTVADLSQLTDALCRGGPEVLRRIGAEAVIGDQMEPAAGLLAAHLGLPQVSLAPSLPIDRAPGMPPAYLGWGFDPSERGRRRVAGAERVVDLLLRRQRRTIATWAERFDLPQRDSVESCLSPLARIAQTVRGFDFPRPAGTLLHHVGPFRAEAKNEEALPAGIDPERPFVYASLGTMQGHRIGLFRAVARACRSIGVPLAIAHCGGLSPAQARSLDAAVVTDFLPQRAVLRRASACVTHAGLNTALDALEFGVPCLAIPIAFDQPGVAARLVHCGAGLRLSRVLLSSGAVEASLRRLLGEGSFLQRARTIGAEILASGGAEGAADIIENVTVRDRKRLERTG